MARVADSNFLYNGELGRNRNRMLMNDDRSIATLVPFEDPKSPGTWYFFTPQGAVRYQFEYPPIDIAEYRRRVNVLEDEEKRVRDQAKEIAKKEGIDLDVKLLDFMMSARDYARRLNRSYLSSEAGKAAELTEYVEALAKREFPRGTRTRAAVIKVWDVSTRKSDLESNPPWADPNLYSTRYVISLPNSTRFQIQPFWNYSKIYKDTDPWREVAVAELREGECREGCVQVPVRDVEPNELHGVLDFRMAERLDAYWKHEVQESIFAGSKSLLEQLSTPDNRKRISEIREGLASCNAASGTIGTKSRAMIDQIDRALGRMPEVTIGAVPPALAASPKFIPELTCISAIANSGGELGTVGVGIPDPDDLSFDYTQVIVADRDAPALLFPAEDTSSPGTWYLFTPWMSYRYSFKYPDFDFSGFQQKVKPLEEQMDQIGKHVEAAAKREKADVDKPLNELDVMYRDLRKQKIAEDAILSRVNSEIKRLFAPYPRTQALVAQLYTAFLDAERIRRNAPWGKEGTPLGRYELTVPGVPKVQVIPVITVNMAPPFGDGAPWRNVALRKITGLECQGVCTTLQPVDAFDERSRGALTSRVLHVLDQYWKYQILGTEKTKDGHIREATQLDPSKVREFSDYYGRSLRSCASTPGPIGERASQYLSEFQKAGGGFGRIR
jgi:hypothetical protein